MSWSAARGVTGPDVTFLGLDYARLLAAAEELMTDGLESLSDGEAVAALQELTGSLRPTLAPDHRLLVASPPSDDQMFLAGGLEIVVVLAALVTLLQTKLDLRVSRKDGHVDFDVQVIKAQASDAVIQKVVEIASDLLKPSGVA